MAHPDCKGAKVCSAPGHRRLRDRADADCTADTPSTVLPRSRHDSAGAADPVGSLSSDQMEVLHHCGWSGDTTLRRALIAFLELSVRGLQWRFEPAFHVAQPLAATQQGTASPSLMA